MQVSYSHKFIKQFKKCPDNIKQAFKDRLVVFMENEFNPILNNHCLGGKLKDYRSINITGDWRSIFKKLDSGDVVIFIMIGTHSQLYS